MGPRSHLFVLEVTGVILASTTLLYLRLGRDCTVSTMMESRAFLILLPFSLLLLLYLLLYNNTVYRIMYLNLSSSSSVLLFVVYVVAFFSMMTHYYVGVIIILYYIIELYIITTTLPPSILQRKNIRGTSAACTSFQFCWNAVLPPFYDKPTPVRPGHFFPRITPDKWRNTYQ